MEGSVGGVSIVVVSWFIFTLNPVHSIMNSEGNALIVLKDNIIKNNGDPKNVFQTWDLNSEGGNPCTWFHVTCDNKDNLVRRVDLGNSTISCQLVSMVSFLGELKYLEHLELYDNRISGTIPDELVVLTNLKSLDLYNNDLTGPIPQSLGKLSKLTHLNLHGNRINDTISDELGHDLTNLELLDLSSNDLEGPIPESLGKLSKLTHLNLYGNRISGTIPDELGHLTNLEHLDLNNNDLTGSIPSILTTIASLTFLDLSDNNLSGVAPINGSFSSFTCASYRNNTYLTNPPGSC